MRPNDESVVQRASSQNGYPRDYPPMEPFQTCSQIKVITLRRKSTNVPLGFSIRGGWEHGTGVFVSEVQPGSISQRQGLRVGDQIVRINGFSIHRAIHMEVLSLLKTCPGVILKVKRVGVLPVKERRKDPVTWKVVDTQCLHSLPSRNTSRISEFITDDCVIIKIEFSVLGASIGCSIAKGPPEMPGIFMCTVKEGGVADEAGLEVGDQIMDMNGTSFYDIKLADAVALMKSSKDIKLTVKKRAGISLFSEQLNPRDPPPPLLLNGQTSKKNGTITSSTTGRRSCSLLNEHDFSGSNSSKSEENSSFRSTDSEKDYSISEESGIHSLKPNQNGHHGNGRHKKSASLATTVSGGSSSSDDAASRLDDRWILEEKRKLQDEQKKLMIEKQLLEEEKRRLKQMEKSCGSSSCASSSSSSEDMPSTAGGFLEELQKKAAKMSIKEDRRSIDQLISERRNGDRTNTLKRDGAKGKGGEEDDVKRRQHELLMEEFQRAHRKMFGQNNKTDANEKVNEKHDTLTKSVSNSSAKTCPPVPTRSSPKAKITINGQNPGLQSQTLPRPDRTHKTSPTRQQTSQDDLDNNNKVAVSSNPHQINFRVTFDTKRPPVHDRSNKNSLVKVTPWNTRL